MKRGYIKIFRKFFREHEFWNEKRTYSKAEAWIDLVECARWKDEPERLIDKRGSYILELGDVFISDRYLSKRWGWSTKKVRNFLNYLLQRESIKYKIRSNKRTIITITNLKSYLGWETSKGTTEEPVKNQSGTTEEPKKKPLKKVKPVKPIKHIYGEFSNVKLSEDEYKKLIERFGEKDTKDKIENLSLYLSSKGDKYKSHYATILSWAKKDKKSNSQDRSVEEKAALLP